ncbi:hypothetical protein NP233_g9629 [Leucocoprinus birnbaumii]|uniref:Uncharacterized protein n=1 Tax=Leucocoprinus birnbaumii TaxID=56174 RepID=A0AAD5VMD4_9AGAR|nr:hypothetical protein NP233_g9629 [Leucocoprinus birnbaumii]
MDPYSMDPSHLMAPASRPPTPPQVTEVPLGPQATSFATHAARNPLLKTIKPALQKKVVYDKQSIQVNRAICEEKQNKFIADLEAFHEAQDEAIKTLAVKYHCKVTYLLKLVAKKAKELNQGKPPGECATPSAICQAVKDDLALANMDIYAAKQLRKDFEQEQEKKKLSVRINNKAATLDYNHTVDNIENEMKGLEHWTGINTFGFFTRGHVNDTMQPAWVASSPVTLTFLPETMQKTPGEVGRHFELWACMKSDTKACNELVRLQSECSEMVVQCLREITGRRNVTMSYQYYETDIQSCYSVELKGWPEGINFKAPGKITTMYEIRTLHTVLCSEANPIKKTRQPRKHKNDENTPPSMGEAGNNEARKRRKKAAPKSCPIVEDE